MSVKYDEDFYGWIFDTIRLLQEKKFDELDIENLIEELKDISDNKLELLIDSISKLVAYLLQWQYQPDSRKRNWDASIQELRKRIKKLLIESPGLETMDITLEDAYEYSVLFIKQNTYIEDKLIPQKCPYTFEQIMDDEFYPE